MKYFLEFKLRLGACPQGQTRRISRRLPLLVPVSALLLGWTLAGAAPAAGSPRAGTAAGTLTAVICAYPPELQAMRAEFGVAPDGGKFEMLQDRGMVFYRGVVDAHPVILFQAGASLVNAAFQLQLALDRFPITRVIFAGVAGGVDPALHVGDVVIPERWYYHGEAAYLNEDGQGGYVRPSYLRPAAPNFGMIFPSRGRVASAHGVTDLADGFPTDPALLAAARAAAGRLPPLHKAGRTVTVTVGGHGVSGTVFLDNARYREWIFRNWQACCVDMESTAYAQVCYANETPLVVIQGLSDLAGGQKGANPIDANELDVAAIAMKVAHALLDELPAGP